MALRLEQLHPSLVHLPIALVPLAIGADLLGSITGRKSLHDFGRRSMAVAAAGAVVSALTGLIAGEEVNVEGRSRDQLMTHRNLNAVATLVATGAAVWRARTERPSAAYFGIGAVGMGVLAYTAYLGGQLVYEAGAAVAPAHGVFRPEAPTLRVSRLKGFAKTAATDLGHAVQHMVRELRAGYILPAIVGRHSESRAAGAPPTINSPT